VSILEKLPDDDAVASAATNSNPVDGALCDVEDVAANPEGVSADVPTGYIDANVSNDSVAQAAFALAQQEMAVVTSIGPRWLASDRSRPHSLRYPDFLIIGAQKAGTTWLHQNLDFHPSVWLPPIKEINYLNEVYLPSSDGWESTGRLQQASDARGFFATLEHPTRRLLTRRDALEVILRNERTDEWYGRIFSCAGDDMVCGEISPDYALLPRAAIVRLLAQNPAAKFIMVLRDPIARAWSHMRMTMSRHPELDAELLLNAPEHWSGILGRSNYPELLKRWNSLVAPPNLIVLSFDDLVADPGAFLENLCRKLGLHYDVRLFPNMAGVVREGGDDGCPEEILRILRSRLRFIYDGLQLSWPTFAAPWVGEHYCGS
jgi:hypothetical protein